MIPITPELLAKMGEAIANGGNVRVGPPSLCWEIQVEGNDECSSWVQVPLVFFCHDEESAVGFAEDYGETYGQILREAIARGRP